MSVQSKERIRKMIAKDITDICLRAGEVKKSINDSLDEAFEYLNTLIAQIPQSVSGPLIAKTPKTIRKKAVPKIETIAEDDASDNNTTLTDAQESAVSVVEEKMERTTTGRTRREASKKADSFIRQQQSLTIHAKQRRPSEDANITVSTKSVKEDRLKRRKAARSSDEDDDGRRPSKHSKLEEKQNEEARKTLTEAQVDASISGGSQLRRTTRKRSSLSSLGPEAKKPNMINETVTIAPIDDLEEHSMYEDAIGKPTPIMNSTMKPNSTIILDKMMNVTVVLEPLSRHVMLNETVTLQKASRSSLLALEPTVSSKKAIEDKLHQLKSAMAKGELDELMTDDESSPDVRRGKAQSKRQEHKTQSKKGRKPPTKQKRELASFSSEDEVVGTPAKTFRQPTAEMQSAFKSNALFSPYAKESVRKRVEAFEQAGLNSPKSVNIDAPTRLTRTKARAMAAAEAEAGDGTKTGEKTVAQKLARKSLARAKKISLARQIKCTTEESKENNVPVQKVSKAANDKVNARQQQQRITPLGKIKTLLPMSTRNHHTPATSQNLTNARAMTGSRTNIVTVVDSFIQTTKSASKPNSADKFEEKKRNEEDVRRKREEALRLQTEEKRKKRQEKELKNKLAREAKERLEMEKRLKIEKEREEKARLAQQMQEKQKEELERKKQAQLQRAYEKEERRRLEEQQRLLRLQEQEEAERMMAEQRRREQEAERRKDAEARAQMQAAAEAMKHQTQAKLKQHAHNKNHGPTNYILDSEPDDEESDDESRPKHVIPYWAQPHVRKIQLSMQRHIPDRAIFQFFDTKKCTPDLTEMFDKIDRSRLKRTSSAIWKTPPRYSMMETD